MSALPQPAENHACLESTAGGGTTFVLVDEADQPGWYMWRHGARWGHPDSLHKQESAFGGPLPWDDGQGSVVDYGQLVPGETWRAERIIREVTR